MRRLSAAAAAAALIALAASDGRAQPPAGPHAHPDPGCPVCVYGPHKETVKTTVYGTKAEPFCLRRVSLLGLFHHAPDCGGECLPPRTKARLVKWEVAEERLKLRCSVESIPVPAPVRPGAEPVPPLPPR